MSDEGDIILKTGATPQAAWSFDPNFYVRFEVGHKKPHLYEQCIAADKQWVQGSCVK